MGILDDIKSSFRKGSSLTRLIYINIGVFLLLAIVSIISYFINSQDIADKLVKLLAVPSSFKALLTKPWTLITYMFTHREILHILFNMLWLYWFGTIFLEFLDQKKLVAVYLLGGLCGAIVYIIAFNVFPVFDQMVSESIAIGASASVMAIVVSIAVYVPDYTVILFLIGRVRIKYIAIGIFILTSVLDFSVNTGGKLAHLGGALLGFFYTVNLRRGRDLGKGINSVLDYVVTLFKPRKKFRVTYKKPVTDYEYNKAKAEHQHRINEILDKISKGGYDSLTKEEKELLFKEGQKKN
jgi:membrane associated rhomboid family serine protease